jgi:hypothetical protein
MALKKTILIDSIGVPAQYHVVDNVNISRSSNCISAMVLSYFTEDSFKAGKAQLGMATAITIPGVPPKGVDSFLYAEQMLVQSEPDDGEEIATVWVGAQNRYLYADAEIVPDIERIALT